jgi:hypothetical protein
MKNGMQNVGSWFRTAYDRLIAFVVLLVLLVSLVFLGIQAKVLKASQQDFDRWLASLRPVHEQAAPVDRAAFERAETELKNPVELPDWTNRVTVPELRVSCMNCERPIPYSAMTCSVCKAVQPGLTNVVNADKDKDGMPDEWELKHGLNPLDKDDALADADQDGFRNKEEFDFGSDPRDASSYPPPLAKLRVVRIAPIPFHLEFKAVSQLGSNLVFQVNARRGGGTYWVKLGEAVDGFTLAEFDPGAGEKTAVLTLSNSVRRVRLLKNQQVPQGDYEVVMLFEVDSTERTARVGGEFELKGIRYRVKGVDIEGQRVLIGEPAREMDVWIGRTASGAAPGPKPAEAASGKSAARSEE